MKDRIFYELDPYNRLIVKRTGLKSNVRKFRKALSGRFKTDPRNNRLYYEVYKPCNGTPQKIEFSGKYSLDKDHNLIFSLNKWNKKYGKRGSRLRAKLIGATGSELVFMLRAKTDKKEATFYTMTLNGAWQVDKNNRLVFGVKKDNREVDRFIFLNAWSINKNNEIEYRYGKGPGIIILRGKWDIRNRHEIRYVITEEKGSALKFSASLARFVPARSKAYVKFETTIDVTCGRKIKRTLSFVCKYKPGRGKEIVLEVLPSKRTLNIKLGPIFLESFFKDKEKYCGGGMAFRW